MSADRAELSDPSSAASSARRASSSIALAFVLVVGILLARSVFGRYVYAVGDNAEAARLSGVRVMSVQTRLLRPLRARRRPRGVIYAGRYGSGASNSFYDTIRLPGDRGRRRRRHEHLRRGSGAVWRGVIGVLILALIGNGFNLLGIDPTYQLAVQGMLIFAAVAGDQYLRRAR